MLQDAGHNFIDPRGRLLPRSYDILGNQSIHCIDHSLKSGQALQHLFSFVGLYTTFIFQKPDPEIAPPLTTPFMPVGTHYLDEVRFFLHF